MEEYKISLGAEISQQGLGNVKDQIKTLESNPIKLTLDKNLSNEIKAIKEQIDSLGSSKGKNKNALAINTDSVEKSLNDVHSTINEIKTALGTIDSKSGMKSLLSSINQISTALEKASGQFGELNAELKKLSSKDFGINIDLKFGSGKNPVAANAAYGQKVRNETLPQLKQQYQQIAEYIKKTKNLAADYESVAINFALKGGGAGAYDLLGNIGNSNVSLAKQMEAYKQMIAYMKKAASMDGIDLSSVTAGFSKSADDLIGDAKRVQSGLDQTEKQAEETKQQLKGLFGSGIDSEALNAQLDSIVNNLNEIKSALQSLSANNSIDGLTQSFNGLSQILEKLIQNAGAFKQVMNAGVSGVSSGVKNVAGVDSDSFVDKEVLNMMKELGVAGGKGSEAFREIKSAMLEYIAVAERAGNETGEVVNELAMLERSNAMSKVRDTALNYGATQSKKKELKEQQKLYKDFYADIRKTNKNGTKIFIPADVQAELPKNITRSLGSAFITKDRAGSMELDSWLKDLSERFPYVVDRTKDLAGQLMDVFQKLEIAKGRFSDASVDSVFSDNEIRNAENVIENAADNIVNSQQRIQDASSASAEAEKQNEQEKRSEYDKTLKKLEEVNSKLKEHENNLKEINDRNESYREFGATDEQIEESKRVETEAYWSGQEDELARYNALLEERVRLENELKNIKSVTVSSGESGFKETSAEIGTLKGDLKSLQDSLRSVGFNEASVESLTNEFKQLGITVTGVNSQLDDAGNLTLTVKGIDKAQQAVTVVGKLNQEVEEGENAQIILRIDDSKVNASIEKIQEKLRTSSDDAFDSDYHKQISKLESDFGKLSIQSDELRDRINSLKSILSQMYETKDAQKLIALNEQLEQSLKSVGNQIQINAKSAEEAAAKEAKARAERVSKIKIDIEVGSFDDDISKIDDKFNRLSNASVDLRNSIDAVKKALNEMENAAASGDDGRLIRAQEEYAVALEKTNNLLRIQAREEKALADAQKLQDNRELFQSNIDTWLVNNSKAADMFGATMLELKAKAESCDQVELNHLISQFKKADKAAERAGVKGLSVLDQLKEKFKEYSVYFSAAEVFMWVEQGLRDMFEQVKLIDSAMTELKKVTDETAATYNRFLSDAASSAKEIGTTIDGLVESTAQFARLGYGFEDSQGLAEVANIYAVVGDEVEGVEGATTSLISTMAAFKSEMNGLSNTDFAMGLVDKMNEVGNNFAISSGGIGEALQRSASSMSAANNTIDETIALITAAIFCWLFI